MLSLQGMPTRLCDRIDRREVLRVGGLSSLGLSLPGLLASTAHGSSTTSAPTFGRAKNVIYVWMQGGPPQHETFDPKPEAPSGIRGVFSPIQTNIPGINFCELLPRTARIADKLAIVRSIATDNNQHSGSGYEVLTGYKYRGPNPRRISPEDWPWFGSLVKQLRPSDVLPSLSAVWIPQIMRLNENVTPAGQTSGFLGRRWDPDRFSVNPSDPQDRIPGLQLDGVPGVRLQQRLALLEQVDRRFSRSGRGGEAKLYGDFQAQAFDMLLNGRVEAAFDVKQEPAALRGRYGRGQWNQCLLLARRLVEAGVRLVHVNWVREPGDSAVDNPMWDTHAQNADRLEDVLCPQFDVGFTALIEDLDQRGLLDETLVVAIGEFGRTPKINPLGGRDHWGPVFSFALAGAGVSAGQVHGASDRHGAYPARDRVTPADLTATLFHLLGIDHARAFYDTLGREHRLTTGEPIWPILGTSPATTSRAVAEGSIQRVLPMDGRLLTQEDFSEPGALREAGFGSRPKGWRAAPLLDGPAPKGFGVFLSDKSRTVHLGFAGVVAGAELSKPTAAALLGQELRNPRAGTFVARVKLRGRGADEATVRQAFTSSLSARLEFCRYGALTKDPRNRQTLAKLEIPADRLATGQWQTVRFQARLDSARPGANFAIGKGLGMIVVVEPRGKSRQPTSPVTLEVSEVEVEFLGRTINDEVTV